METICVRAITNCGAHCSRFAPCLPLPLLPSPHCAVPQCSAVPFCSLYGSVRRCQSVYLIYFFGLPHREQRDAACQCQKEHCDNKMKKKNKYKNKN